MDLFEDRGGSPLSKKIHQMLFCRILMNFDLNETANLKHKLKYNIDESIFEHIARYGDLGVLERGLNKPTQTMKFTRSNGQTLLNFINECPRYLPLV